MGSVQEKRKEFVRIVTVLLRGFCNFLVKFSVNEGNK